MWRLTRGRARRRLIGVALVLTVLLTGGAATVLASTAVDRGHRQLGREAMDRSIGECADAVADEVGHYADAVRDVAAAIGTGINQLTRRSFIGITEGFSGERLPGATTVNFVVPARDPQVAATQAHWRARGAEGLTLFRTGTDVEHKFVVFGRTFTSLPPTPGRDLSMTPAAASALDNARRGWRFAMGSAYIAMRDRQLPVDQQQVSVTMAAPVLDARGLFRGWVVLGVHADDFLRATLSSRIRDTVNVRLTDIDPVASRTIVAVATGTPMGDASLDRRRELYVGQRLWRIDMQPTVSLLGQADQRLGWFTPIAGGAFTLLLALLVAVLTGARNRAMEKVDRATAALRSDIERREEVETRLRERESELHELAFHDQLTGLANRGLFYDRVAHALRTHSRQAGTFAVFFIDLDGFKEVNDRYGHGAGDLVLKATAARLQTCLRDSDTVARFGGDEFAVVAERLAGAEDVHITADRMVTALRAPIPVGAGEVTVTASIGVALNRSGDDTDAILRAADVAMYEAKTSGKSRHVVSAS